MSLVRIKSLEECSICPDCGEPYCDDCQKHYSECDCISPSMADEDGLKTLKIDGVLYGERKTNATTNP